jgi:glycerophosphoryl diester phosphodiesterase
VAPITFAHRGARLLHPENTLPAFRAGLEAGARGLETDAWMSADGEVVLTHDVVVGGPVFGMWKLRVSRASAARLARHGVPRLTELFTELGADYDLSIDVKDPAAAQPIIDIVRRVGDPARTWLCSPDLEQLCALRDDAPDVRLVHSTPRRRLPDSLERHAADLAAAGIDAMNLRHSEWTKGIVVLFHRFDVRAFAWDVQEVRHIRAMLEIAIDALYCDHVERMVAAVGEWSPGRPEPPRAS